MATGIDDVEQKCHECKQLCCNRRSLGNHVAKSHKELDGLRGYVMKHMLNGIIPKCLCGCGEDVLWHKTLYKFNDYVTGHNSGTRGFCNPNFKHTPEQIMYRNACIKKTYTSRRVELSAKIGDAVSEAFKDPVKNKNLSDGQKRGWNNKERRKQASDRAIVLLSQNKIGPHAPFKTCWFKNPFTGKEEFMHSSWERLFLEACIAEGYPVTKEHGIQVSYVGADGHDHVYLPDFKAIEENVLFEIKGKRTSTDDLKEAACREWCRAHSYELVVIGDTAQAV